MVMSRCGQFLRLSLAAMVAVGAVAAAGCQTPDRQHHSVMPDGAVPVSIGLVLAGPVLQAEATAVDDGDPPERWELARNDDRLGRRTTHGRLVEEVIEVRTRDRIRSTTTGRVRDSSYTNVRTIIRRRVE